MSHFAKINKENIVEQVIVAEQEFINSGAVGNPEEWVQTSYNTCGGKHTKGGTPLRKNYAGIGFTYNKEKDAFIPPQPYPSWTLNEETCLWESPKPFPKKQKINEDVFYDWSEEEKDWVKRK